ncbi:hypothetical protein PIB30_054803 [Stylosanthes scabra]|uniref:Aminotransferase-like plant mobile domain-containing protein n=1 Tax=Stylosanthes scabra TaxID=79078 RepID=A0ABU6UJB8_9FABA|nr:hypothetical protein [Stylosanthes scabra]
MGIRGRGRAVGRGQRQSALRSSNIGRLTREVHLVGAVDFQFPRLLELRRGSIIVPPPDAIVPYIEEAGFEGPLRMRDFDIDGLLLSSFVERDRVRQTPVDGPPDVLRQYARCYILLMIGCWLFPDKSDNMVLNGLRQGNRDMHDRRMIAARADLDRVGLAQFVCTPYDDPAWDALRLAWMLTVEEQLTWRAVVPIVGFMYVRMHHVDRVKRQLEGEQQVPADPVNLDGFLSASARGEDQWWPVKNAEWYDAWRGRFGEEQQVTITPTAYPAMATREYFTWWIAACRN